MYKFTDQENTLNNLEYGGTFNAFYPCGQSMVTVFHFLQNSIQKLNENIFRKYDYGFERNYQE